LKIFFFHIERLKPFAGIAAGNVRANIALKESSPLITWQHIPNVDNAMDIARKVLHSIDEIYSKLLDDKQVTFTDALVWAIVVDRPLLARAIWRHMDYPIHSALLASHLYSVLVEWFQGEEGYQQCRDWFETEALSVLAEVAYDDAIPILKWEWQELNDFDALKIAELGECKEFTAHPYVQRYLNKKLYYDSQGHISPGTPMWKILLLVVFPFLIPLLGTYAYNDQPKQTTRFYHFYNLPVVKIVTSTTCYILYLALLTLNVIECIPGKYEIEWYEICLWIWIVASMIEEVAQYIEDPSNYFYQLSNQMDLLMNLGLIAYFVLRMLAWTYREEGYVFAYTDVLIVANIMCYIRLMNVFAVSKSLGPLFFVIIRLFNDVLQWSFIFMVFLISFQIGIFALTRQAHHDPWEFYPQGTLGVGFSTIIGQPGDNTMEYMEKTHVGVFLISIYALISQIMLVNLLIAMMGDTYSNVKSNSDKEWKFYRYGLITEYMSTSAYPPPFNLVLGPLEYIKHKMSPRTIASEHSSNNTVLHMKIAKEKTLDNERIETRDSIPALSAFVRESTRLATNQADGDRAFMEYNMTSLQAGVETNAEIQRRMLKHIENLQLSLVSHERSLEALHNKLDAISKNLKIGE
jgi:hypothetical protein